MNFISLYIISPKVKSAHENNLKSHTVSKRHTPSLQKYLYIGKHLGTSFKKIEYVQGSVEKKGL